MSTGSAVASLTPAVEREARERHRVLLDVDDRPGIVGRLGTLLARRGANIIELDSHAVDSSGRAIFYVRVEVESAPGTIDAELLADDLRAELPEARNMCLEVRPAAPRKRVCVLVSKYDHCLLDLLTRAHAGELECDIDLVVSNHPNLADEVARFGIECRHIPVTRNAKAQAEQQPLDTLDGRYDLLVLARYMQILSGDFLSRVEIPTINIHHSFLPAFAGADPYARARERGVKIIGATAHYVTEDLDAGPIIEQDVARVSHRDTVEQMTRTGRDIERTVLARAVKWHLEDRVAVNGNSTVVFA